MFGITDFFPAAAMAKNIKTETPQQNLVNRHTSSIPDFIKEKHAVQIWDLKPELTEPGLVMKNCYGSKENLFCGMWNLSRTSQS